MPDADVYQGSRVVARLERVAQGVRLSFVPDAQLEHGFLATQVPARDAVSTDLPPFFLNLLPEGARLRLLLESARSQEDSLDLLLRVGWDAIGDVAVLPTGAEETSRSASLRTADLSRASFWDLFYAGISERPDLSVPGAQEKISASTVAFGVASAGAPSAILKLNPPKYPRLVHNEEFFLRMGKACGLEVNQAKIVHDRLGEPGLLVPRFDRVKQGKSFRKLHQEDACQLLNAVPANKYRLSMREIADAIASVCSAPIVEIERLLRLYAFSYLIGNGDLHAKNISVLWNRVVRLSPAYDLLSTLPYPFLDRRMALQLQGRDDNFRVNQFIDFARPYGVPERAIRAMIDDLCTRAEPWLGRLSEIGFEPPVTEHLGKEIADRIRRLRR
jgi:serine/threonine-protein kinase HipA